MGIYDRDYFRAPASRGGFAEFRIWSITIWLIAINVAIFLLDAVLDGWLTYWGRFSLAAGIYQGQVWRFITFQFLHASPSHIFFNMLGLYCFGPIVESYLGARRFLAFYLLCGVGGGVVYVALCLLGVLQDGPHTALVGASAGIIGVLIGAARIAPSVEILVLFFPVQLRMLAWIVVAYASYTVLKEGMNAGGEASHLGGAVVGFILIQNIDWLNWADWTRPRMRYRGRRAVIKDWRKDMNR